MHPKKKKCKLLEKLSFPFYVMKVGTMRIENGRSLISSPLLTPDVVVT
jgi:hypothetical protein